MLSFDESGENKFELFFYEILRAIHKAQIIKQI